MFKIHQEILDETRRKVFLRLTGFKCLGVLGGGTAIALQIGHRRSFDFDFFLKESIRASFLSKVRSVLGPGCTVTLNSDDQLNLVTPENVYVTFFYDVFPLAFSPIQNEVVDLMDLRDLAVNKARTIGFRGKWRDYVDVYFLLSEGRTTLAEIISVAERRCGAEFSSRLFLQQLVYFEDIGDYTVDFVGEQVSPEKIKDYLRRQVKGYDLAS